jgi:hypothetical protein
LLKLTNFISVLVKLRTVSLSFSAAWALNFLSFEKEQRDMPWKHISPILKLMTICGVIVALAFGLLGVWLVSLGSAGQTEFSFFGQTFKSANVGIGAIFIAGVTVVLVLLGVLRTVRHTTTHGR